MEKSLIDNNIIITITILSTKHIELSMHMYIALIMAIHCQQLKHEMC